MSCFLNSPYAQDIGMTIVHSLWQLVLVAILFAIANRLLARRSANLRYLAAYASLMLMLVAPALTLFAISSAETSNAEALAGVALRSEVLAEPTDAFAPANSLRLEGSAIGESGAANETDETLVVSMRPTDEAAADSPDVIVASDLAVQPQASDRLSWLLPWLSIGWVAGVIVFSLRPFLALRRCRQIRKQAQLVEDSAIVAALDSLCHRIGLKRTVQIAGSALVHVPTVMGMMRPIVLLPFSMLSGQTPDELSAIIAHELAHIRRHDFLFNLFQTAIETLLFYHPAVWWVSSVVRQERENCCDDIAMAICGRKNYATALANLESARTRSASLAIAADGGSLYRRIHRIVRPYENPISSGGAPLAAGRWLASLIALTALLLVITTMLPSSSTLAADNESEATEGDEVLAEQDGRSDRFQHSYHGQVLLPDGKPAVGADVFYVRWLRTPRKVVPITPLAKTDSEGRFRFTHDDVDDDPQRNATIVAKLDGYAFAWAKAEALRTEEGPPEDGVIGGFQRYEEVIRIDRGQPMRLRPDDAPVTGRVVDTEGNGVPGVSVYVSEVLSGPNNTLEAWSRVVNGKAPDYMKLEGALVRQLRSPQVPSLMGEVKTADDGRFAIHGIGKKRIAAIVVRGSGIVTESVYARTDGGRTVSLPMQFSQQDGGFRNIYHGNDFTLVAERSRPVAGRVTDPEENGIAGVVITSPRSFSGPKFSERSGNKDAFAVTNAKGQYRLEGLPASNHNQLTVLSPADSNFLSSGGSVSTEIQKDAADRYAPVKKDLQLKRGIVIEGRAIDAQTGHGVVGDLRFVRQADDGEFTVSMAGSLMHRSNRNGMFRVVMPKANGALTFTASQRHKYRMADSEEKADPRRAVRIVDGEIVMFGTSAMAQGHAVHKLKGDEEGPLRFDWRLERATVATGHAVSPSGERMTDFYYTGRSNGYPYWIPSTNGDIDIYGFDETQPRRVAVIDKAKKLAGVRMLRSGENGFRVKLRPWATVRGRIVNKDGEPLAGVNIHSLAVRNASLDGAKQASSAQNQPLPLPPVGPWGNSSPTTDGDGRFEIAGLISGETYHLHGEADVMNPLFHPALAVEIKDLVLKPSEIRNVGDLVLKKPAEQPGSDAPESQPVVDQQATGVQTEAAGAQTKPASDTARKAATKPTRIHGRVVDAKGEGVAGKVFVVKRRSGFVTKRGQEKILHEFRTDSGGRFDVSVELPPRDDKVDFGVWNVTVLQLVATADGFGPAISDVIGLRKGEPVELRLPKDDVPIEGAIRTLEGEPVAGATVRVALLDGYRDIEKMIPSLRKQASEKPKMEGFWTFMAMGDFLDPGHDRDENERITANQLQYSQFTSKTVTTDEKGRFRLTGFGRDRMLALELAGPGIVKSWVSVIARDMEPIHSSMFVGGRTQMTFGAKFSHSVEPSRPIIGKISDVETGKPIAGVRVESRPSGSVHVSTLTDANGEYRLDGLPKSKQHTVNITPPQDAPYFSRRYVNVKESTVGLEPTNADFKLRRTKWYTGRVVDKATGKPVAAKVMYSPRVDNASAEDYPAFVKGRMSGAPFDREEGGGNVVTVDDDGKFRVRVIPGDGMLFVKCDQPVYCTAFGRESMDEKSKWWGPARSNSQRMTNTYQPMFPEWVHRMVPIQIGESASPDDPEIHEVAVNPGRTFDVRMVDAEGKSLANVSLVGRISRAFSIVGRPTDSDRVTIPGITADNPRGVFFYHKQRNLGAFLVAGRQGDAADGGEHGREKKTVRLLPCATLKGQLLDRDGKPLANSPVGINPVGLAGKQLFVIATTDKDGKFTATRVVPGVSLNLYDMFNNREIKGGLKLKAGEVLDLGAMKLDVEAPQRAASNSLSL